MYTAVACRLSLVLELGASQQLPRPCLPSVLSGSCSSTHRSPQSAIVVLFLILISISLNFSVWRNGRRLASTNPLSRSPLFSLRHASCTADDARSVSSGSGFHTPMKHQHAPPSPRQDPQTNSPASWRRAGWNRSGNISNTFDINPGGTQTSMVENMLSREADVTARIYSSSSSSTESSAEEAAVRRNQHNSYRRASRHRHRHNRGSGSDRHRTRSTAERDEKTTAATAATVALLRSELEATRSLVEQKEVVTRSLQRELDQVSLHRVFQNFEQHAVYCLVDTSSDCHAPH